jgi:uncharacterized protein YjlB
VPETAGKTAKTLSIPLDRDLQEPDVSVAGFPHMLLEDIKRQVETMTGIVRPSPRQAQALVRSRKANAWRFADDGLTPNNPHWPLIHYRGAVKMDGGFDPAAIFEVLFESHGWRDGWRDGIYDFLHYHSRTHEVLGLARGHAQVRFGGARGRNINLKAGDVIVQPAGTGHQRLSASDDLLVVGAYPGGSDYDECHPTKGDHDRALRAIAATRAPRTDPVFGNKGPLKDLWR